MLLAGVSPNSTIFADILPSCAKMGALEKGMDIHQTIIDGGFLLDIMVGDALIDMYGKCGSIDKARELFERMPQRNVVFWTTMIGGYAQNEFIEKALETFKQMHLAGVKPNSTTSVSILLAYAKMLALEEAMGIHQSIIEGGFFSDVIVGNAQVDMYAKFSIDRARELFNRMPQRDVISWNVMIAGYAQNGFSEDAARIFELIKQSGTYPNIVTLTCALRACSHTDLVNEGCKYFNDMSITPTFDHYVCMVDLLAHASYLEDSLNFIIKMSIKPLVVVWMCFLSDCRLHMNMGLGVSRVTLLSDMDPKNAATYVLLSNIYAEVG